MGVIHPKWCIKAARLSPRILVLAAAALAAAGIFGPVLAQRATIEVEQAATRTVTLAQNKSKTIRLDRPFASTIIGQPEIADVLALSDHVIYIQGKKVGTTNVSAFDKDKRLIAVLDIDVTVDTQVLAAQIRASTGVGGITVASSNGQVVLSGVARDAVSADKAIQIAKTSTPTLSVVNAMRIASVH